MLYPLSYEGIGISLPDVVGFPLAAASPTLKVHV